MEIKTMPTPPEIYMSREWSEKPVNVGEIYSIQSSVQQVIDSERAAERREWVKEIAGCAVLVCCLAMFTVIWMVLP